MRCSWITFHILLSQILTCIIIVLYNSIMVLISLTSIRTLEKYTKTNKRWLLASQDFGPDRAQCLSLEMFDGSRCPVDLQHHSHNKQ